MNDENGMSDSKKKKKRRSPGAEIDRGNNKKKGNEMFHFAKETRFNIPSRNSTANSSWKIRLLAKPQSCAE